MRRPRASSHTQTRRSLPNDSTVTREYVWVVAIFENATAALCRVAAGPKLHSPISIDWWGDSVGPVRKRASDRSEAIRGPAVGQLNRVNGEPDPAMAGSGVVRQAFRYFLRGGPHKKTTYEKQTGEGESTAVCNMT
ncbi:MAG TPA: hypothetical protein DD666_21435 [Advenella kashmirensis]|uniref:Uncharacterized protein n=1 Tax=Advenella kashmirensis TaxID=310575 RepID=A0A356LMK6_9BURK|nr:hypothetical protein [Advenella kashmirensis]